MGGWGSGPRRPHGTRRTVESCLTLDAGVLRRRGLLQPGERSGTLTLGSKQDATVDYALSVGADGDTLRLIYTLVQTGERLDYVVRLVRTPCHFGGSRLWLVCPLVADGKVCGRR